MSFAPHSHAGIQADRGLPVTEMGRKADWRVTPSFQGLTLEATPATSFPSGLILQPSLTARTQLPRAGMGQRDEQEAGELA